MRAAVIKGVSSPRSRVLGSAPAPNSNVTIASLPLVQARERGVTP